MISKLTLQNQLLLISELDFQNVHYTSPLQTISQKAGSTIDCMWILISYTVFRIF